MRTTTMTIALVCLLLLSYPSYATSGDYFSCDDISYFSPCGVRTENTVERSQPIASKKPSAPEDNIWAEPLMGADGTITYKIPPIPVMHLLEDPSKENAMSYINWNKERMKKMSVAMAAVAAVSSNQAAANVPEIVKVDFIFSPECRYCKMQAPIVQQFAEKIGKEKVVGYVINAKNRQDVDRFINETGVDFKMLPGDAYAKQNNISAWPTIIMYDKFGKKTRIDGLTESLENAVISSQVPLTAVDNR